MRLIDADNLFVHYTEKEQREYGNDFEGGVLFACDAISKNAPTVDAVPVCRCAECKHYNKEQKNMSGYCRCDRHHKWQDEGDRVYMPPDGFCSYGERKGADE